MKKPPTLAAEGSAPFMRDVQSPNGSDASAGGYHSPGATAINAERPAVFGYAIEIEVYVSELASASVRALSSSMDGPIVEAMLKVLR